jgi:hypothetical protein
MRLVQPTPAFPHLALVTELSRSRGATKLDKRRIRAIPKIQQVAIDPPNLHPTPGAT